MSDRPTLTRIAGTPEHWRAAATAIFRAGEAMVAAGKPVQVTLTEWEDDLTARQRGFLHAAVFPQVAEQAHVGERRERFVAKIWKEYFRERFLGHRWEMVKMPGQKRATPRKVRISTEDLGIKAYSDYIDKVIDHAVDELGVVFVFRGEEREAVRYRPPKRKQAAAPAEQQEAVPA